MPNISRTNQGDIQPGKTVAPVPLNNEFNNLVTAHNAQEAALTSLQSQIDAQQTSITAITSNVSLVEKRLQPLLTTGTLPDYVLTPSPAQPALYDGLTFTLTPHATNTGNSTLNVSGLGAKAVRTIDGEGLPAGTLVANNPVILCYVSALDAFVLTQNAYRQPGVYGCLPTWATNTTLTIAPGSAKDYDDATRQLVVPSTLTVDLGAVGANGRDYSTGVVNSTQHYLWVVYNPTTKTSAGLISQSATAPTMPSGFTQKARLPISFKTDASGNLVKWAVDASSSRWFVYYPSDVSGLDPFSQHPQQLYYAAPFSATSWTNIPSNGWFPTFAHSVEVTFQITQGVGGLGLYTRPVADTADVRLVDPGSGVLETNAARLVLRSPSQGYQIKVNGGAKNVLHVWTTGYTVTLF